jgi:hypothetical protein
MERVGDIGKNGRILFDRLKPTAGCSANGRRRIAAAQGSEALVGISASENNKKKVHGVRNE